LNLIVPSPTVSIRFEKQEIHYFKSLPLLIGHLDIVIPFKNVNDFLGMLRDGAERVEKEFLRIDIVQGYLVVLEHPIKLL
jgi:hypothetical protein